jgi:hypothetical protein
VTAAAPAPIRVPLPPGATEPFAAPAPQPCAWCEGSGVEPDEENGAVPCLACNGSGTKPVSFDLPRTRTYEMRAAYYEPACAASGHPNRLVLMTAKKATHRPRSEEYHLAEIDTDWNGRAFVLAKVTGRRELRNVFVGPEGVTCDCEGETYQATAKANQRAHDEGDDIYSCFGCKHQAALAALLLAGWFDLEAT